MSRAEQQELKDARERHLDDMERYSWLQLWLALDREIGELFEPVTIDWLIWNACAHVVNMLGFVELTKSSPLQSKIVNRTRDGCSRPGARHTVKVHPHAPTR